MFIFVLVIPCFHRGVELVNVSIISTEQNKI